MAISKRTMIRQLIGSVQQITSKRYGDDAWLGVLDAIDAMKTMLKSFALLNNTKYELNVYVENGGYRTNKDNQQWKEYKISITDKLDKEVFGGLITCSQAGTVEDPWKHYDLTIQIW